MESLSFRRVSCCEMLHFVTSYKNTNVLDTENTREYGLEIIFKFLILQAEVLVSDLPKPR